MFIVVGLNANSLDTFCRPEVTFLRVCGSAPCEESKGSDHGGIRDA